jgi:hypothetical protein
MLLSFGLRLGTMHVPSVESTPRSGSSGRPAGSASGLAIARSARAILGPRGRTVKLTNQRVTHADEWRRPVQERPDGVAVSSGECGRPPGYRFSATWEFAWMRVKRADHPALPARALGEPTPAGPCCAQGSCCVDLVEGV